MQIKLIHEQPQHYFECENLIRESFWDVYTPGTDNHYFVNILRSSTDYLPNLSFLAEVDGEIAGAIYTTKSRIIGADGVEHPTVTFGPLGILPKYQRHGMGKILINAVKDAAAHEDFKAVIIFGSPSNYVSSGFNSGYSFGITTPDGKFPAAMLVLETFKDSLKGVKGKFYSGRVFEEIDQQKVDEFDKKFPPKQKGFRPSQTEFQIISRAVIE